MKKEISKGDLVWCNAYTTYSSFDDWFDAKNVFKFEKNEIGIFLEEFYDFWENCSCIKLFINGKIIFTSRYNIRNS